MWEVEIANNLNVNTTKSMDLASVKVMIKELQEKLIGNAKDLSGMGQV